MAQRTPNEVWSRQQAEFINALLENARNFPLSKEEYLRIKKGGARNMKRVLKLVF